MSHNCQHLYEENIKLLLINTIFWLSSIFLLWKWNFWLIFEQFCSNENYVFSIKPHPPLIPGKVFDIFKVCSAGQFIAAFPITVILKKMRKRTELCSKFLGDWWIKRKYEALWNFFYIYGNAEERKWNLSKKKFYWTNAGFCEDLLWTRNSALFGLLDVQHFLFGRLLISKLEGIFFNWELRKKTSVFYVKAPLVSVTVSTFQ